MKKLYIKRSSLRLAAFLHYSGLALILLAYPYTTWRAAHSTDLITENWLLVRIFSLFIPGSLLLIAGILRKRRLYRCPKCGHELLERGYFSQEPPRHCSGCGEEIDVRILEKKSSDQ